MQCITVDTTSQPYTKEQCERTIDVKKCQREDTRKQQPQEILCIALNRRKDWPLGAFENKWISTFPCAIFAMVFVQ